MSVQSPENDYISPNVRPPLTRKKSRFCLGIFLLILVDVIWVASSEATKFLFSDYDYNKPYMSTYIKTSMFSIYLAGFLFVPSWRRQCIRCACDDYPGQYQLVGETDTEDTDDGGDSQAKDALGESIYVPANIPSASELESGSESERRVRSKSRVKFSNLMEVKELDVTEDAQISRMNYGAAVRAKLVSRSRNGVLTVQQVVRISFLFSIIFFLGNVAYQEALNVTDVAVVNIISSFSGVFTLVLAAMFPSGPLDRFTLSKFIAVTIFVVGLVLITLGSGSTSFHHLVLTNHVLAGVMWSLLGAFCYALYLVMLKRCVGTESKLDVPMFFGFVGLFSCTLLWSGLVILHYLKLETFQLPNKTQAVFLVVNGLVGTVVSELLWLWGCLYTSSLIGTMSLSLTIPLSIVLDIVLRKVKFTWMFYVGVIPVFLSFVIVAYLSHVSKDPLLTWIKKCFRFLCCCGEKTDHQAEQEIPLTSLRHSVT